MHASQIQDLNLLVRQVFRTFYPENFIVVNELLRHTEFVEADALARRLNLSVSSVVKALQDMKAKRFVREIKYGDLVYFWGFDYHSFVNVVRYKIHMLKGEKSARASTSGGYVCDKCGRDMGWEQFVKLGGGGQNGMQRCPMRGCDGNMVKAARKAAEGLKVLEVFAAALKKLEGADLPVYGTRNVNERLQEAAAKEAEQRTDGIEYEVPQVQSAQSKCVVQIAPPPLHESSGFLVPPELRLLLAASDGSAEAAAAAAAAANARIAVPPWLRPNPEDLDGAAVAAAEASKFSVENELLQKQLELDSIHVVCSVPVDQSMRSYYRIVAKQISRNEKGSTGPVPSAVADDGSCAPMDVGGDDDVKLVMVRGEPVPLYRVSDSDVAEMTAEEYELYFKVHQEELERRMQSLLT